MNKQELIDMIAEKTGMPKVAAQRCLDAITETIKSEVAAGRRVRLTGFGVFERVLVKARVGRNPRSGTSIAIPSRMRVRFSAGNDFRSVLTSE